MKNYTECLRTDGVYCVCLAVVGQLRSHLWSRVSGDQAGELERLSLSDGVNPLGVTLLLHVTRVTRVHDTDSRRRCGEKRQNRSLLKHQCLYC